MEEELDQANERTTKLQTELEGYRNKCDNVLLQSSDLESSLARVMEQLVLSQKQARNMAVVALFMFTL